MGIASPSHLIIILVLLLLMFGAKRIPELARGLGEGMREFKKGTSELGGDEQRQENRSDSTSEDLTDNDESRK